MTTVSEWDDRATAILRAGRGTRFDELVRLSGLDPARDFRFADLSGVDFSGCDLRGFDFTGARLHGCRFEGAHIADLDLPSLSAGEIRTVIVMAGANFTQAELGQVIHRPGRDPHAPAETTEITDLTKARDWEDFCKPDRWTQPFDAPVSDAHLPTGAIFQDAPFAPQMVVIPAGEFWMGSPDDEPGRGAYEGPRQRITFEQRFALGRFAVTFDEYDAYAEAAGVEKPEDQGWRRGRRPVINVSHRDAEGYARWLSEVTGQTYRLPSEAEWEYACRAGTETPFWWGDTISPEQANYNGRKAYNGGPTGKYREKTVEVDRFDPNPWGLCQMYGNVWEWCADVRHEGLDGVPPDGAARQGADATSSRVVRGGSWLNEPNLLRSGNRSRGNSDDRYVNQGFRVVRSLSPSRTL